MTRDKYSYDKRCEELAEVFLCDTPRHNQSSVSEQTENVCELAQQIQDSIEMFVASLEDVEDVQ